MGTVFKRLFMLLVNKFNGEKKRLPEIQPNKEILFLQVLQKQLKLYLTCLRSTGLEQKS